MAQEGKLDLLLKTLEENEKRRVEAEDRARVDLADLKKAIEARLLQVEKKVNDICSFVTSLSTKVEQLEGTVARQGRAEKMVGDAKEEPGTPTQSPSPSLIHGMRDPFLNSFPHAGVESSAMHVNHGVAGSLPLMSCPQFNEENPQMWRANCEVYFDVYGVLPSNWVKVATLNFVGNAAFWLQSVRNQLIGVTWHDLCGRVCARFTRDKQQALIRQWFHVKQVSSVSEYVERFDIIMHQLNAYDSTAPPEYFMTKFVDGLKDEIRTIVLFQRPQDLDVACSLAFLQEEALEGVRNSGYKRSEASGAYSRTPMRAPQQALTSTIPARQNLTFTPEENKVPEYNRSRDDRISALKAYRKSKGLCFTCGERWSKEHKCATSVQLQVVQELLDIIQTDNEESSEPEAVSEEEEVKLMAISQQALNGTESNRSIRLRGWIQGFELLMLVDSGSTHSFIDE